MEDFNIEKNIPLPRKTKRGVISYPFDKMDVGDSFLVPYKERLKSTLASQVHSNAKSYVLRSKLNWVFSTRQEEDGVRIWRVK